MVLNEEKFQSEVYYGTVMLLIKEWLTAGLITKTEYAKIERLYADKYNPILKREGRQD